MSRGRIEQQPAYVLHHRPFRDTSQLLDIVSADHGRLTLVARATRSPRSRLKGILRPFMPLSVSWVQRRDLGTLTGAEVRGGPLQLSGEALLAGYYLNELLLHFLHRHDPQPEIYAAYSESIRALASSGNVAWHLRLFEIELLRQLGYALELEREAGSDQPLVENRFYDYRFETGPVRVEHAEGNLIFSGAELMAIGARQFDTPSGLRAAGRLLREVIAFHLGGKELKSRRVLVDLRRVRIADPSIEDS